MFNEKLKGMLKIYCSVAPKDPKVEDRPAKPRLT